MENKIIPEDLLKEVQFINDEVHTDKDRRSIRSHNLRKAMKLGNLYKRKVKIHYKTLEGVIEKIETSVWAVGSEFVTLKKGNHIPIRSIDHIEF